jgi:hypothetical protein
LELKINELKPARRKWEGFRRSSKRLLLTYSQVAEDLTGDIAIDQLKRSVGWWECAVGREPHEKGGLPSPHSAGCEEEVRHPLPREALPQA